MSRDLALHGMLSQYVNRVLQGNCLSLLKELPSNSIDLIVTSPPYADNRKMTYGGIPASRYVEWFLPISEELKRVLKPDGSLILNIKERVINGERGTYVYRLVMDMREQGWLWTEEYAWVKKNTHPGKWPNRFRDLWEHCYHFTKSKDFNMYQRGVMKPIGKWAQKRMRKIKGNDRIRRKSKTKSGFSLKLTNWSKRKLVYPGNVILTATESANMNHSAAFPTDLPAWFIKLFSRRGDVVLDPFLGSGTTAVAALNLGRRFIGMEINEEYCKVSRARINEVRETLHGRRLVASARVN